MERPFWFSLVIGVLMGLVAWFMLEDVPVVPHIFCVASAVVFGVLAGTFDWRWRVRTFCVAASLVAFVTLLYVWRTPWDWPFGVAAAAIAVSTVTRMVWLRRERVFDPV